MNITRRQGMTSSERVELASSEMIWSPRRFISKGKNWFYSRAERATSLPTSPLPILRNLNWPRYKDTRSDDTPTREELKIPRARAEIGGCCVVNIAATSIV